jgi:hypothetical protein
MITLEKDNSITLANYYNLDEFNNSTSINNYENNLLKFKQHKLLISDDYNQEQLNTKSKLIYSELDDLPTITKEYIESIKYLIRTRYLFLLFNKFNRVKSEITQLGDVNDVSKKTAIDLIRNLEEIVITSKFWFEQPLINSSVNLEIVCEWWHDERKLSIYVEDTNIEFVKVWGTDIDREMEDGTIDSLENLVNLWQWMTNIVHV